MYVLDSLDDVYRSIMRLLDDLLFWLVRYPMPFGIGP